MRGVSKPGGEYNYYADANQLVHTCQCPQRLVRADRIEKQVVKWISNILQSAFTEEERNVEQQVSELEARFERATQLHLSGEIDRQLYESEKTRLENAVETLHIAQTRAKLAQHRELQPQFRQ